MGNQYFIGKQFCQGNRISTNNTAETKPMHFCSYVHTSFRTHYWCVNRFLPLVLSGKFTEGNQSKKLQNGCRRACKASWRTKMRLGDMKYEEIRCCGVCLVKWIGSWSLVGDWTSEHGVRQQECLFQMVFVSVCWVNFWPNGRNGSNRVLSVRAEGWWCCGRIECNYQTAIYLSTGNMSYRLPMTNSSDDLNNATECIPYFSTNAALNGKVTMTWECAGFLSECQLLMFGCQNKLQVAVEQQNVKCVQFRSVCNLTLTTADKTEWNSLISVWQKYYHHPDSRETLISVSPHCTCCIVCWFSLYSSVSDSCSRSHFPLH